MMGPYWNGDFGWMGWLGMGIGMLLNLGIVVLIVYFIAKAVSRDGNRTDSNAIEILRERYAKGEIDEEELNKRMEVLKKK